MSDWPRSMDVRPVVEWPGSLTVERRRSPFSAGLADTLRLLDRELWAIGSRGTPVLQVAIPVEQFRRDGRPRSDARATHPGVILTVVGRPGALTYPCDSFRTWQDNLRAIALALEALRKVDRYGVTRGDEQYRGFLAIEGAPHFEYWQQALMWLREAFEQRRNAPAAELIRVAKRRTHPDVGDRPEDWHRVLDAERVLREADCL